MSRDACHGVHRQWRAQTSGGAGAKWCYEGTMVDWGVREVYGFDPPWLGVGDVAKISYFFIS